jgi:hypothetical protein
MQSGIGRLIVALLAFPFFPVALTFVSAVRTAGAMDTSIARSDR